MSWSANPVERQPATRPSWWANPPTITRIPKPTWRNQHPEINGPLAGAGSLTATVKANAHLTVQLSGDGSITGGTSQIQPVTAPFNNLDSSETGTLVSGLSAWPYSLLTHAVDFGGDGRLDGNMGNDGLTAHLGELYQASDSQGSIGQLAVTLYQIYTVAAAFSSIGGLTSVMLGDQDGLHGTAWPGIGDVQGGAGTLSLTLFQKYFVEAEPEGNGTLSAAARMYQANRSAALAGSGALSNVTVPQRNTAPALAGAGTLSATADIVTAVPVAVSMSGAGVLTNTLVPQMNAPVALAGSGALTNTTVPQRLTPVALSGAGALTAGAGIPTTWLAGGGATYSDNFNRANSSTTIGASWTNRLNTCGIYGNGAYPVSGSATNIATYNTAMNADDVTVSSVMGAFYNGSYGQYYDAPFLVLGANTTGQCAVAMFQYSQYIGYTLYIYLCSAWGTWGVRASTTPSSWTTGSTLSFRRVGNVYTASIGGVDQLSYTDTSNELPRDADHRLVGLGASMDLYATFRVHDSWSATEGTTLSEPKGEGALTATAVNLYQKPTVVGTPNLVSATSIALPAHQIGDDIYIFAGRNSNTQCSKPAASSTVPAWVDIDTGNQANSRSLRTAHFRATRTNHTSGTWSNANTLCAVVVRGAHATTPVGGHARGNGAATPSPAIPAITLAQTDDSSMVLYYVHSGSSDLYAVIGAPSGYTSLVSGGFGFTYVAGLGSKNSTTSDGATTAVNGQSSAYSSTLIEIRSH